MKYFDISFERLILILKATIALFNREKDTKRERQGDRQTGGNTVRHRERQITRQTDKKTTRERKRKVLLYKQKFVGSVSVIDIIVDGKEIKHNNQNKLEGVKSLHRISHKSCPIFLV